MEIMKPNGDNIMVRVEGIYDEEGNSRESAPHPKEVLYIRLSEQASVYDILRRKENN